MEKYSNLNLEYLKFSTVIDKYSREMSALENIQLKRIWEMLEGPPSSTSYTEKSVEILNPKLKGWVFSSGWKMSFIKQGVTIDVVKKDEKYTAIIGDKVKFGPYNKLKDLIEEMRRFIWEEKVVKGWNFLDLAHGLEEGLEKGPRLPKGKSLGEMEYLRNQKLKNKTVKV